MSENTQIALVTGANKGIGFEVARQLGALGMTVLLGARDERRREDAVAALRADDLDVRPVALDVTDSVSVQAAADHVDKELGRLDVLVNNAGINGGIPQAPTTVDPDTVRAVFETNVFGVLMVTNAMLPALRRSPAARIVNVSSEVGSLAAMTDPDNYLSRLPPGAAYPPSKTALNSLTLQYAKELREEGILVNAVTPGACATDFTAPLNLPLTRTAADGAAIVVRMATLGPDGPTGGFFADEGPVPW